MRFKYQGINEKGAAVSGEEEAESRLALARNLRKSGVSVTVALEIEEKKSFFTLPSFLERVSLEDKIFFASNLSAMISSGLSLSRAFSVLARQASGKKFSEIISAVEEDVKKGSGLSDALAKYPEIFSHVFVAMVASGESSGKLADALSLISDEMKKSYELKKKTKGAMIYPAVVFSLMIAVGIVMLVYVVPTLSATFTELKVELPMSTKFIIGASAAFSSHIFLIIAAFAVFVAGIRYFLKSEAGKRFFDKATISLPVVGGIAREYNAAMTARTLSSLISSGVDLVTAIGVTENVLQNVFYKEALAEASKEVEKGGTLSAIFSKYPRLFNPIMGEMTRVGEETGKLSEMLARTASFYEERVDQSTKDLSTIIEPAMMIVIGIAVGFFAVSIIQPIYNMGSGI